jgi:hypothetical protein
MVRNSLTPIIKKKKTHQVENEDGRRAEVRAEGSKQGPKVDTDETGFGIVLLFNWLFRENYK